MPYKDAKKQKEAQHQYYLDNKEKYAANVRRRKQEYREWFTELRESLSCTRCPEKHMAVLDFHHLDDNEKYDSVSVMVNDMVPKKKILKEIEKCIVLCSNCHRKLHWDLHQNK